jgi:hypothetical protein
MSSNDVSPWGISILFKSGYQDWKVIQVLEGKQAFMKGIEVGYRVLEFNGVKPNETNASNFEKLLRRGDACTIEFEPSVQSPPAILVADQPVRIEATPPDDVDELKENDSDDDIQSSAEKQDHLVFEDEKLILEKKKREFEQLQQRDHDVYSKLAVHDEELAAKFEETEKQMFKKWNNMNSFDKRLLDEYKCSNLKHFEQITQMKTEIENLKEEKFKLQKENEKVKVKNSKLIDELKQSKLEKEELIDELEKLTLALHAENKILAGNAEKLDELKRINQELIEEMFDPDNLESTLAKMDMDHDGYIDENEFTFQILVQKYKVSNTLLETIKKEFHKLDKTKDGQLSLHDFDKHEWSLEEQSEIKEAEETELTKDSNEQKNKPYVDELTKKYADLKNENKILWKEIMELREEHHDYILQDRKASWDSQAESDLLILINENEIEKPIKVKNYVVSAEAEIAQFKQLEIENQRSFDEVGDQLSEIKTLKEDKLHNQSEIETQSQKKDYTRIAEGKIAELLTHLKNENERYRKLETENKRSIDKIAAQCFEIETLNDHKLRNQSEIVSLKNEMEIPNEEMLVHTGGFSQPENEVLESLKRENARLERFVKDLSKEHKHDVTEMDHFEEEHTQLRKQIEVLRQDNSELMEKNLKLDSETEKEIESLNSKNLKLEAFLKISASEKLKQLEEIQKLKKISALNIEDENHEECKVKIQALEGQLEKNEIYKKNLEEEFHKQMDQLDSVWSMIENENKKHQARHDKVDELHENIRKFQNELPDSHKEGLQKIFDAHLAP